MKTLEEKRNSRPGYPKTREEFDKWIAWHANPDNAYAWDFEMRFEINGHRITASNLRCHLCVDGVSYSVRDEYSTVWANGISYKPTDYIKLKIFG